MNIYGYVDMCLVYYVLLYGNEILFEVNKFIESFFELLLGLEKIGSMFMKS